MLRSRATLGIASLLATGLVLLSASGFAQTSPAGKPVPVVTRSSPKAASPKTSSSKTRHRDQKSWPAEEVPQPAPVPPTPEQQPPAPPQVTYRDGQLSIVSTNSTLSQILRSVQQHTGAVMDMPPGAGSERVVATLGPGKPQAVLSSLLDGSKFNYVIVGESKNPGAVQKVVLLAKSTGGVNEPTVNMAQNNLRPQPPVPQQPGVEPPEDEYPQNEPEVENQNQVQPGMPGFPGNENLQPEVINPGNRTPEQMLQELQRMQQQQQQMQQQLNPANQQQFGQPVIPQQNLPPGQAPNPPQYEPR